MSSSLKISPSTSPVQTNPSTVSLDPKQTALNQCIERVNSAIKELRLKAQNSQFPDLHCQMTKALPKDPFVIDCGHIFERTVLQNWKKKHCPSCPFYIYTEIALPGLRAFTENLLQKDEDPVVTRSNFTRPNPGRTAQYLEIAKSCINEENYEEALECYKKAFEYTDSLAEYVLVPTLYDQLKLPQKAALSRLYLGLYQLEENKIQEALETLESCDQKIINTSPLIAAFKLETDPSAENIEWAMEKASTQEKTDDAVFIYKQILRAEPGRLDAYQRLIPLIEDKKEKWTLLLKAAAAARAAERFDLARIFQEEANGPVISQVITKELWANAEMITLPPYPQELQDFLAEDCTIWPGKKRAETHTVIPLFPEVVIEEDPIPLTLNSLNRLDYYSEGRGKGFNRDWCGVDPNKHADSQFHYGVLTNDVIPESQGKSWTDQQKLIPEGYQLPRAFDIARAFLWDNRRSKANSTLKFDHPTEVRCYETYSFPYPRQERIDRPDSFDWTTAQKGKNLGVYFSQDEFDRPHLGIALWRKFKL